MANLTPHFTDVELGAIGAPVAVQSNLTRLAGLLESFRQVWGVPVKVDSGYRSAEHNAAVGGVETSQHLDGTAADVVPLGLSLYEAAAKVDAAERVGALAPYGQLIFYPYTTGHVHVSLPTRGKVREKLVKLGGETGGYAKLNLGTFPRWKRQRKRGPCP